MLNKYILNCLIVKCKRRILNDIKLNVLLGLLNFNFFGIPSIKSNTWDMKLI